MCSSLFQGYPFISCNLRFKQIAMSVTEVAMREKEEEYNRAIEEDKIRREERRLRRQQKAIELMQAQAAVIVNTFSCLYFCLITFNLI